MDEFDILQIVGEGWFGKILLVEHRATDTEMVLKGKSLQFNISMEYTYTCTLQVIQTISMFFVFFLLSLSLSICLFAPQYSIAKALRVHSGLLPRISFRYVPGLT
jgi:hypothetical protein